MLARKIPPPETLQQPVLSIPGLHIIANLKSSRFNLLRESVHFKDFAEEIIIENKLNQLGSVYHDFPSGGFTAVICLAESHLSVHTWPETGLITFDVFLSNYQKNNRPLTESIYNSVCDFFQASVVDEHFLNR